jgi:acyl-CoA thioesterase-1
VDVRNSSIVSLGLLLVSLCTALMPISMHAADRPTIVCYGDSITAGYGLEPGQSFPDFLQRNLDKLGYHYKVNNRGTSGATTKDAVAGIHAILQVKPEIVVVEFGGNDGLRGLPIEETQHNLGLVLTTLEAAHIKVVFAGITLPPNYGQDYIRQFEQVFRLLAAKHRVVFVPMLYKDIVRVPGTIQEDGIHPTAKGAQIIANTLMPYLRQLLRRGP